MSLQKTNTLVPIDVVEEEPIKCVEFPQELDISRAKEDSTLRVFNEKESLVMKQFIKRNLKYPASVKAVKINDTCFLQFRVVKTGEIDEIGIKKGIPNCLDCDKEAVRVVQLMSEWNKERYRQPEYASVLWSSYRTLFPVSFNLNK